ncbi:MAG: RNA-directed DNA polymerase [Flavobacteriaceae bacterium]|nr:RNA-directed DNA polymerase [Flavobacteriaceae bacterium]
MSRTVIKVDKKDFFRALLTDTFPAETPLIFSNEGFYNNILKIKSDEGSNYTNCIQDIIYKKHKYTIPFIYKINKGDFNYRSLSLIHPGNQVEYAEFYQKYGTLITSFCKNSKSSIRSPKKVGNSYFILNNNSHLDKYRTDKVVTTKEDMYNRYSTSYFAYIGYNRLHRFIDSMEFQKLEKKFAYQTCLDISKCFDTIYTHSITWATKDKAFAKDHISSQTFGNAFDSLMQTSNYNETNGIPIGAEVSRIFAEIILNKIDSTIIQYLESQSIKYNTDYVIRRYVDDYFIFCTEKKNRDIICAVIGDHLNQFKLNINTLKTIHNTRPFFSARSAAMKSLAECLNSFFSGMTDLKEDEDKKLRRLPVNIRRHTKVILNLTKQVKRICIEHNLDYSAVSGYTITSIFTQISKIIEDFLPTQNSDKSIQYSKWFKVLIEIAFFFYSVAPTVNSSYQMAKILITSVRFFKIEFPQELASIEQFLYTNCLKFLNLATTETPEYIKNHLALEKINILLAMQELGDDHLLTPELLEDTIDVNNLGYFEIITILFYIKDHDQYSRLKEKISKRINSIFLKAHNVGKDSSMAHLLCDIAACPYLSRDFRKKILNAYRLSSNNLVPLDTEADKLEEIILFESNPWFVNWSNVDLLNQVEKKELLVAY